MATDSGTPSAPSNGTDALSLLERALLGYGLLCTPLLRNGERYLITEHAEVKITLEVTEGYFAWEGPNGEQRREPINHLRGTKAQVTQDIISIRMMSE